MVGARARHALEVRFHTYSPITRWLLRFGLFAPLLIVSLTILAIVSGAEVRECYNVLLGIQSPYEPNAPRWTLVFLSVIGWTIVPALIGCVTALVVERQIATSRPSQDAVLERLSELEAELRAK